MEYRNFGTSDLKVSAIGFGCWEMGGQHYGGTDDAEVTKAIHRAIDLGVTLFDTAPNYGYGGSEIVLGKALGAKRKDIILVSSTRGWCPRARSSRPSATRATPGSCPREGSALRDLGHERLAPMTSIRRRIPLWFANGFGPTAKTA